MEPPEAAPLALPPSLDLDSLMALATSCRSSDGQFCVRVYAEPGADPEYIVHNFDPNGTESYATVKEWDTAISRPRPPALVFDSGQLLWRDNRGTRPLRPTVNT